MSLILAVLQHATEAAATTDAGAHEASPNVFALSTSVSFWTVVIFLILMAVLAKFAFPPILGYAAAREKRIQDALDAAKNDREESQRLLEEQRQALVAARLEAQTFIADAQKAADRVRKEAVDKARAEQEEIITRAKADIAAEGAKAMEGLRREAADLAMAAASKLIETKLDSQEDRRIVTEFLASVDRSQMAGNK